MPTYEYECRKCSYRFEAFQSINDAPLKTCPLCGGKVKRLIGGGSGIIFKGSGFYITDSRKAQSASTSSSTKTPSHSNSGGEPACSGASSDSGTKKAS